MTFRPSILSTADAAAIVLACLVLGACSGSSEDYYPLEAGRWWDYATETTILDETTRQRLVAANLGDGRLDDHAVHVQRQSAGREVYFVETERGLERLAVRAAFDADPDAATPPAALILPRRRAVGESWKTATRLRLIESRTFARQDKLRPRHLPLDLDMSITALDEAVSVPAGDFEHCLRIDGLGTRSVRTDRGNALAHVTVEHSEWYAPGVGLVRVVRTESAESPFLKTGHYEQALLRYE